MQVTFISVLHPFRALSYRGRIRLNECYTGKEKNMHLRSTSSCFYAPELHGLDNFLSRLGASSSSSSCGSVLRQDGGVELLGFGPLGKNGRRDERHKTKYCSGLLLRDIIVDYQRTILANEGRESFVNGDMSSFSLIRGFSGTPNTPKTGPAFCRSWIGCRCVQQKVASKLKPLVAV